MGEDLISRARSAIAIGKGRGYEPSEDELRETVLGFAVKMAESFNLETEDADPDYSPNNAMDRQYAAEDAIDDMDERSTGPVVMSKSASKRSRRGRSETYNVYFGEPRTGKKSVTEIVAAFIGAHGRSPNALEKERLRNFVAMQKATEKIELGTTEKTKKKTSSAKSVSRSPSKVLVTPIKEKKASKAKGFSVYYEKPNAKAEEMAVKWFERFQDRRP